MESKSYVNLISVITGVSMILTCSLIAYLFQKNLFGKYRNKVANTMNKEKPDQ